VTHPDPPDGTTALGPSTAPPPAPEQDLPEQDLPEQASSDWTVVNPEPTPATLVRRLAARVIDLGVWIAVLFGLVLATDSADGGWLTGAGLTLWSVCWLVLPVWRGGATVGKRLCGIRVVRSEGGAVALGRAFLREAFIFTSVIIPMIGVLNLLAGVNDPRRQSLHDKVIDTVVINRA
jgi:uncharacterized RDD family membrane protein YckC